MIGTGASPLRPNIACSRSDCSVLVGSPVDGPPRWTSTTISGSSSDHRQPDRLALQRDSRARRWWSRRAPRRTTAPSAAPMPAISSSAWNVRTPNRLCLRQLVQDVRAGVIGYAPRNSGSSARTDGRDQPVAQREVAGDVAVGAGAHRRRLDLVRHRERLGGLAEVPAGLERRDVGVADARACLANLRRRNAIVASAGRPYSQDSSPSANMFLARAASLR